MMPQLDKINLFNEICCTVSTSITIVQLILLLPKNLWLNKIFLILNSESSKFIVIHRLAGDYSICTRVPH